MIDRYGPFGRAAGLRQMMDRLLEDAVVLPREGGGEGWAGLAVDVYEEGDDLVVEAHLPGVRPDDLDVNVERGVLTISGQTEPDREQQQRNYLLREQRSGRFTRSLQLPSSYDTESCRATFEQGVLRLAFPKADAAKPRRIRIGTGGRQGVIEGQASGPKEARPAGGVRRKAEDRA